MTAFAPVTGTFPYYGMQIMGIRQILDLLRQSDKMGGSGVGIRSEWNEYVCLGFFRATFSQVGWVSCYLKRWSALL